MRALPLLFLGGLLTLLVVVDNGDRNDEAASREAAFQPPGLPAPDPGCSDFGNVRPVPDEWRTDGGPRGSSEFFAPRAGIPPSSGTPYIAGVQLPKGSRCPRHWATDRPVEDAYALAGSLAEAFPATGLWPLLWEFPETPDHYLGETGDPRAVDRIEAGAVIRGKWRLFRPGQEFPGLAEPQKAPRREAPGDPFGALARAGLSEAAAYLILVPAHRPSDFMSVAGFGGTAELRSEELTAVLRSWEDRFQAVPALIGPGTLTLAVGAPPSSNEDALRLAHEQLMTAPATAEAPEYLAERLRSGGATPSLPSRHFWPLGWPD